MRINVYAEEMTDRIEIIEKKTAEGTFTGVRFYMELPVTVQADGVPPQQVSGPFMHHEGDDDSSAVTFWGKHNLHATLQKAIKLLDQHYNRNVEGDPAVSWPLAQDSEEMAHQLARVLGAVVQPRGLLDVEPVPGTPLAAIGILYMRQIAEKSRISA